MYVAQKLLGIKRYTVLAWMGWCDTSSPDKCYKLLQALLQHTLAGSELNVRKQVHTKEKLSAEHHCFIVHTQPAGQLPQT